LDFDTLASSAVTNIQFRFRSNNAASRLVAETDGAGTGAGCRVGENRAASENGVEGSCCLKSQLSFSTRLVLVSFFSDFCSSERPACSAIPGTVNSRLNTTARVHIVIVAAIFKGLFIVHSANSVK